MVAFRISSNRDGAWFELDGTARPDYYRAELSHGTMQAAVEFYEINVRPVGDFFAELAATWRGWEGERTWRSLEGEVRFGATHDKLGTVTLTVGLRSDVYVSTGPGHIWSASGLLILDAGGLDGLARQASRLAA